MGAPLQSSEGAQLERAPPPPLRQRTPKALPSRHEERAEGETTEAVLPLKVLLLTVTLSVALVSRFAMPPPRLTVEFPLKVLLVTESGPWVAMPPPLPPAQL